MSVKEQRKLITSLLCDMSSARDRKDLCRPPRPHAAWRRRLDVAYSIIYELSVLMGITAVHITLLFSLIRIILPKEYGMMETADRVISNNPLLVMIVTHIFFFHAQLQVPFARSNLPK